MFKKIVLALIVAVAIPTVAAAQKFGVVNAQAIFAAMPESTAAQTQLAEASKKYEEEFKKLQDEMDKKYKDFQAMPTDTPDAIKERRMQEIQELNTKLDRFRQTAEDDLQRQQAQLMEPIQKKLVDAIKAVGAEGNYTFILPDGMAAYQGADAIDVTNAVKAKLGIK